MVALVGNVGKVSKPVSSHLKEGKEEEEEGDAEFDAEKMVGNGCPFIQKEAYPPFCFD